MYVCMYIHSLSLMITTGHTDCVWCVSGQSTNSDVMATSSQVC